MAAVADTRLLSNVPSRALERTAGTGSLAAPEDARARSVGLVLYVVDGSSHPHEIRRSWRSYTRHDAAQRRAWCRRYCELSAGRSASLSYAQKSVAVLRRTPSYVASRSATTCARRRRATRWRGDPRAAGRLTEEEAPLRRALHRPVATRAAPSSAALKLARGGQGAPTARRRLARRRRRDPTSARGCTLRRRRLAHRERPARRRGERRRHRGGGASCRNCCSRRSMAASTARRLVRERRAVLRSARRGLKEHRMPGSARPARARRRRRGSRRARRPRLPRATATATTPTPTPTSAGSTTRRGGGEARAADEGQVVRCGADALPTVINAPAARAARLEVGSLRRGACIWRRARLARARGAAGLRWYETPSRAPASCGAPRRASRSVCGGA